MLIHKSPARRPNTDFADSERGRIRRDTRRAAIAAKRMWLEM